MPHHLHPHDRRPSSPSALSSPSHSRSRSNSNSHTHTHASPPPSPSYSTSKALASAVGGAAAATVLDKYLLQRHSHSHGSTKRRHSNGESDSSSWRRLADLAVGSYAGWEAYNLAHRGSTQPHSHHHDHDRDHDHSQSREAEDGREQTGALSQRARSLQREPRLLEGRERYEGQRGGNSGMNNHGRERERESDRKYWR